jgi:hypothetical protein
VANAPASQDLYIKAHASESIAQGPAIQALVAPHSATLAVASAQAKAGSSIQEVAAESQCKARQEWCLQMEKLTIHLHLSDLSHVLVGGNS